MSKILLVSTDVNVQHLIADMLAVMQFDVFELVHEQTYSGALQKLADDRFDVCLIDVQEGDEYTQHSLSFLRELRKIPVHTPVISLANQPNRDFDLSAMKLGATDYLVKPYLQPEGLERALRYAAERGRFLVEMSQQYQSIHDMEELKSDLVRIAAHDLKNPAAAVLLSADMMMRYEMNAEQQRTHVQRIWNAARMMQRIITEILSAEYIEQAIDGQTTDFFLRQLVMSAIEDYQPLLAAKSLKLNVDFPEQPIEVKADMIQLQRVVGLFLHNAIKYTPKGGAITIRVGKANQNAIIEVQDSGYGVPDELQPRLFQPFFRAQTPETDGIEGNGLGLYLVKRIVTRYGGKVHFNSTYGQGSTFGFELPLRNLTASV